MRAFRSALALTFLPALALSMVRRAHADSSVTGGPPPVDPARCSMAHSPMQRDLHSPGLKKLTPDGHHLRQAAGRRHLLFSKSSHNRERARVIERESGKTVMSLGSTNTALVEDVNGTLLGLLAVEELDGRRAGQFFLPSFYLPTGKTRWPHALLIEGVGSLTATTLVAGDLLLVAFFYRTETGARLEAYDLRQQGLRDGSQLLQFAPPAQISEHCAVLIQQQG